MRRCRNCSRSSLSKSRPSYNISPCSGLTSPTSDFISTVLPEPLCPIIRLVFPVSNTALTPFSTFTPSNDFSMSFISIIASGVLLVSHQKEESVWNWPQRHWSMPCRPRAPHPLHNIRKMKLLKL